MEVPSVYICERKNKPTSICIKHGSADYSYSDKDMNGYEKLYENNMGEIKSTYVPFMPGKSVEITIIKWGGESIRFRILREHIAEVVKFAKHTKAGHIIDGIGVDGKEIWDRCD